MNLNYLKADIKNCTTFKQAGKFSVKENFKHIERVLDYYVLIVVLEGTLFVEQAGIKYEVSPGNILLRLPNNLHFGYEFSEGPLSYLWIHFTLNENDIKNSVWDINIFGRNNNDYVYLPIYSNTLNVDKIIILIHKILDSYNNGCYTLLQENYLTAVLLIELTQQTINSLHNQNIHKRLVNQLLEWIRVNCYKNITLDEIAKHFGYTKSHLCRILKKETKMSILDYINFNKIINAKMLLLDTTLSLKEISHRIGLSDTQYFMRLFKKYENITPTQFRNSYSKTHYNTTLV